jgi:MFS family permease
LVPTADQKGELRWSRNFSLLWGGRAFSEFGDFFGELAISWIVYVETGSAFSLGLTWLIFLIPRSVVRLWGGVYVDRFDRRMLMVFTESTRGLLFTLLAIASYESSLTIALVYAASFSVGLLGALFDLASDALLPLLVPKDSLLKANSVFTATFQVDNILGPAVAGFSIFLLGTTVPLLVDGVSFLVLVIALLLINAPPFRPDRGGGMGWVTDFRAGWAFFRARKELIWLAVLVAGVNFGLGAFWYVYSLIFAKDVLHSGSTGWGLLNAFSALGIFVTSAYLGRRGLHRKRLSVIASLLGMGVFISILSFATNLPEALLAIAAFGASIPLISVVSTTYYQQRVPANLMGRVFGVRQFIDYATIPGGIVFGIFATMSVGVTAGIFSSGIIILLFGMSSIFAGPLHLLDLGASE